MSATWNEDQKKWRFVCAFCGDIKYFTAFLQAQERGWTGNGVGPREQHECSQCSKREAA